MAKEIVEQVSSGGFIFFKDKDTSEIYVLLTRNLKGEYYLPKGKLEPGESQVEAAFREIKEEVGFDSTQIRYIDLCDTINYGYELDDNRTLSKDLCINVFEADKKHDPAPTDWNDLQSVDWHLYQDAVTTISFSKDQLEKAYGIFMASDTVHG